MTPKDRGVGRGEWCVYVNEREEEQRIGHGESGIDSVVGMQCFLSGVVICFVFDFR